MIESECMAKLVDNLLFQPRPQKDRVGLDPIELVGEAGGGDNCRGSLELCFSEYECQDGDKQIDAHDADNFVIVPLIQCEDVGQQGCGMVLAPGAVEGALDIQRGILHRDVKFKCVLNRAADVMKIVKFQRRGTDDVDRRGHYGFFRPYFSILL